jgi:hypothetical protein
MLVSLYYKPKVARDVIFFTVNCAEISDSEGATFVRSLLVVMTDGMRQKQEKIL